MSTRHLQTLVSRSSTRLTNPLTPLTLNRTSTDLTKSLVRNMTSGIDIENKDVKTATGVTLSEKQETLVGSILDLFAGRPSKKKLSLWADDATFEDNITIAKGRDKFEPQWYGLATAFSEIERLHHEVTSSGNPIAMDLKTRYVVKGINKEQTIESKVNIFYDESTGLISKVEDKWGGKLPDSGFKDAMRKLNAVMVPKFVSVPKSEAEEAQQNK